MGYVRLGVRKILVRYSQAASLVQPTSPYQLRHFLLTWLKKQGIDDALIQPYSGHANSFVARNLFPHGDERCSRGVQ